jgi:hypothetical protein
MYSFVDRLVYLMYCWMMEFRSWMVNGVCARECVRKRNTCNGVCVYGFVCASMSMKK